MANNEVQTVITARDEASAVLKRIAGNFEAMKAPIAGLTGMVAGLGAAFAGLSVVTSIKGALAMADEIGKLAQKTGVTVEAFSQLSYAAKLSDVSNEQLATGLKKLSQNMTEAAAGSGEAQKYFKALGVSVTDGAGKLKSADAVMGELAGKFSGMEDGATKTAVAMGVFGKSGADLIPLLNSGADGLKNMADEAQRLGIVMSTDMTNGAAQFNDNLTRLKFAGDGLTITLASQLLPGLTATTNAMVEAAKEGGLLKAVWVGLGGLGAALFTDEFDRPQKKIEALREEMADLQMQSGRSKTGLIGRMLYGEVGEIEGQIEKTKKQIATLEKEIATAAQAGDKAAKERSEAEKKRAEETEARLKKQLAGSGGSGKKSLEDDYSKLARQLSEQIALSDAALASTDKLTEGEKLQAKVLDDIVNGRIKLSAAQKKSVESSLAELVAKQKINLANEAARKLAQESIADKEKQVTEAYAHATAINDEAIKQEDANSVYGQGKAALEELATAKLEARLASIDYASASFDEVDALEKEIIARKRLSAAMRDTESKDNNAKAAKEAADAWQKSSDEINRSLTDALMRGFESGKGFAQNLVDTVKNMFNTMVLRPIISAIVSPVSGMVSSGMSAMGLSGQAAAGTDYMGMASNGSTMNSLYNWTTGASQNTLSYGAFGTSAANVTGSNMVISGSAQEAMLAQQGMGGYSVAPGAAGSMAAYGGAALGAYYGYEEHGVGGAAVYGTAGYVGGAALAGGMAAAGGGAAAAGAGAMAGGSAALSAIPVWGWAALAALALFGWEDGGGPKIEGNAFGTLDSSGDADIVRRADFAAPYGDGDWGRPGADAAAVEALLDPVGQGIADYIKALGGDASGLGIALGYNTDPSGDAPDNVSAGVMSADGQWAYRTVYDTERGKANEAMQSEVSRMMLAAAQAVDISPVTNALLDGIDNIGSLSVERVNELLNKTALAAAIDYDAVFGGEFDAAKLDEFARTGEEAIDTYLRLADTFSATNAIAELLGHDVASAFGEIGLASTEMRQALIDGAGGMDALTAKTNYFYQNFYTEAERLARETDLAGDALSSAFTDMGIAVPDTTDAFRALVEGLDLGTVSGQALYQSLMNIAPAFVSVSAAADEAAAAASAAAAAAAASASAAAAAQQSDLEAAINAAYAALERAVSAQKDAISAAYYEQADNISASIDRISESAGKLQSLSDSLHATLDKMRPQEYASIDRAAAKAQVEAALAIAKAGGVFPDADSLSASLGILSNDASGDFATREAYLLDNAKTAGTIRQLADLTDTALSAEERQIIILEDQLTALESGYEAEIARLDGILESGKAQIDAALGITDAVLSVVDAIANLNAAIYALADAQAAALAPAYQPYSLEDTPAAREAKVEAQTGVVYSASDDPLTAAAKMLYQSTHGGASTADYNTAASAVGGDIGAALGWDGSMEDTERLRTLYGFAGGGFATPGWAMVGEEGPELVNFSQPARVYTAADTQHMMGGGGNSEMLSELRALREEVSNLRHEAQATANHTSKTASMLERVMPDGDALATRATV